MCHSSEVERSTLGWLIFFVYRWLPLVTLTQCILERNIAAGCNWSWFAVCQLLSD